MRPKILLALVLAVPVTLTFVGLYWLAALVVPLPGAASLRAEFSSVEATRDYAGSRLHWGGWIPIACLALGVGSVVAVVRGYRQGSA